MISSNKCPVQSATMHCLCFTKTAQFTTQHSKLVSHTIRQSQILHFHVTYNQLCIKLSNMFVGFNSIFKALRLCWLCDRGHAVDGTPTLSENNSSTDKSRVLGSPSWTVVVVWILLDANNLTGVWLLSVDNPWQFQPSTNDFKDLFIFSS